MFRYANIFRGHVKLMFVSYAGCERGYRVQQAIMGQFNKDCRRARLTRSLLQSLGDDTARRSDKGIALISHHLPIAERDALLRYASYDFGVTLMSFGPRLAAGMAFVAQRALCLCALHTTHSLLPTPTSFPSHTQSHELRAGNTHICNTTHPTASTSATWTRRR